MKMQSIFLVLIVRGSESMVSLSHQCLSDRLHLQAHVKCDNTDNF